MIYFRYSLSLRQVEGPLFGSVVLGPRHAFERVQSLKVQL